MSFQIVQETAKKRSVPICVWPYRNVAEGPFEGWPSQLRVWSEAMNRSGELYVEGTVIFGKHALSVWLFSHFIWSI